MMHWAADYVGRPYSPGGRGPDAYDCWGLVRAVYEDRFDIALPILPGISVESALTISRTIGEEAAAHWREVGNPFEGCVVAMSQRSAYHHVGIHIGNGILHCWDNQNVVVDTMRKLGLKGMKKIGYFKHCLWPTS